jgi:phosphoribosylaminoimidazole-succinocarboxamide synthase
MPDRTALYRKAITEALANTLVKTDLPYPGKKQGKVRDSYQLEDGRLVFITTDRQSAFDRVLAAIPFKGAVLNLTSGWWFERTRSIVPNHLLSIPHPNVSVVQACEVFPIEFVVRGYITGSTNTSLWTHYQAGERLYCGNTLPEGLVKNQQLPAPLLTPTTKETEHDRPISPEAIVAEGWMSQADWDQASRIVLELFDFGQQEARKRGLILVDTKYELGKDPAGRITLIDEVHTPDSSRYWLADSYRDRFSRGQEPENIDKEFLRLWFKEVCDPYHDAQLPAAPVELVVELSLRYIRLYEMITGQDFPFPDMQEAQEPVDARIECALNAEIQGKERLI